VTVLESASFVTDTATLCVFDVAALSHRLGDDADWWSISSEALQEENAGNVAFVDLGQDGKYEVQRVTSLEPTSGLQLHLSCPSGRVFVGAGEEVTSDGLQPECVRGGAFFHVCPGPYTLRIARVASAVIALAFQADDRPGRNLILQPLRLS
jgi:hypothetical protein